MLFFRLGKLALPLLLGLALVLAGCGGSSEDAAANLPTKAQFLRKANAICGRADHRINTGFERYSRRHLAVGQVPSDLSYAKATARIVLPLIEGEVGEIRKLRPPGRGKEGVAEILVAFEAGIGVGKRDPLTLAGSGEFAFAEAHELAVDFGLARCALG